MKSGVISFIVQRERLSPFLYLSMKPYYTLADLLDEEHPFDAGESVPARLAVIGFPIAHSKSPAMQQAALDAAGIRARYIRIQASPEEFADVVRLLREQ